MKKYLITILALFALSSIISQGCKVGVFGKITGTLSEVITGTPIKDASITIEDVNYYVTTDSLGNFKFNNIPAGVYTLRAGKLGDNFQEVVTYNIKVQADSLVHLNVIAELKQNVIFVLSDDTVHLSSLKPDCFLFKGKYGYGTDPKSPNTCIVAVRAGEKRILSRISGIKPYLKLEKPEQAVEAVRLFTNLETYSLFKELNTDNVMIDVKSGTGKKLAIGEMPSAEYKKLGLFEPRATPDEDGFIIDRFLVSFNHNLFKVKEHLTNNGEYTLITKTLLLPHMEIELPTAGK